MARAAQQSDDSTYEDDVEAAFVEEEDEDRSQQSEQRARRRRQQRRNAVDVEIEREITKRAIIESVTRLLVVLLYMAFTLIREREAGVVALDPEDDDLGPEDDWAE